MSICFKIKQNFRTNTFTDNHIRKRYQENTEFVRQKIMIQFLTCYKYLILDL